MNQIWKTHTHTHNEEHKITKILHKKQQKKNEQLGLKLGVWTRCIDRESVLCFSKNAQRDVHKKSGQG